MTASDIIQRLGGVMQLSRDLGLSFTTVSSWGRYNSIPSWRQPALLRLAVEKNIPLSTSDFPQKPLRLTA
jgi:hypothetical protein